MYGPNVHKRVCKAPPGADTVGHGRKGSSLEAVGATSHTDTFGHGTRGNLRFLHVNLFFQVVVKAHLTR